MKDVLYPTRWPCVQLDPESNQTTNEGPQDGGLYNVLNLLLRRDFVRFSSYGTWGASEHEKVWCRGTTDHERAPSRVAQKFVDTIINAPVLFNTHLFV